MLIVLTNFKKVIFYFSHEENPRGYYCSACDQAIEQLSQEVSDFVIGANKLYNDQEMEEISFEEDPAILECQKEKINDESKVVANLQGQLKGIKQKCSKYGFNKWLTNEGKQIERFLQELSQKLINLYTELITRISDAKFNQEKQVQEKGIDQSWKDVETAYQDLEKPFEQPTTQ